MSSPKRRLDTNRTVFIRTWGTRVQSQPADGCDIIAAFGELGVTVSGVRKLASGFIVELSEGTDREWCLSQQVRVGDTECRVRPHIVRDAQTRDTKAFKSPRNVSQSSDNADGDDVSKLQAALQALDTGRKPLQLGAVASELAAYSSNVLVEQLLMHSSLSRSIRQLVAAFCTTDAAFCQLLGDELRAAFDTAQATARRDDRVPKSNGAAVLYMPSQSASMHRLVALAALVGALAAANVLAPADALVYVRKCALEQSGDVVNVCDAVALAEMADLMTGAAPALLGECVSRLHAFVETGRLPLALRLRLLSVCAKQSTSVIKVVAQPSAKAPDSPLQGSTVSPPAMPAGAWGAPLFLPRQTPAAAASHETPPTRAPPGLEAPRAPATPSPSPNAHSILVATRGRSTTLSLDALYARLFGDELAQRHGAALRDAEMDEQGLRALLHYEPIERVRIFSRDLNIPYGHALRMARALEFDYQSSP
jgi:hypothetical protein